MFNANYVAYFDVVMTELWREALGRYQDMVDAGTDMVVAEVNVRFLGPARFDDEVDFEARLTRLGETAMSTRIDASTDGNAGRRRARSATSSSTRRRRRSGRCRRTSATALEPYLDAVPRGRGAATRARASP